MFSNKLIIKNQMFYVSMMCTKYSVSWKHAEGKVQEKNKLHNKTVRKQELQQQQLQINEQRKKSR